MSTSIPPQQSSYGASNARLSFLVLATVQSMLIFTITMIAVPLPNIAMEFGLTPPDLVLLSAAYGLPFSGLLLLGGRLADRYQGRLTFLVGLCIFALGSIFSAISIDFATLTAARFTQGIGAALVAPAAIAILRSVYPSHQEFAHAMAKWGIVSVLGSALGFILSGLVVGWLSWRWMFAVPIAISAIAMVIALNLFPKSSETLSGEKQGIDLPGAILATFGISLISYGLIASGGSSWLDVEVYAPIAIGSVLIVLFNFVEHSVSSPLLPPGFLMNRHRILGLIGIFLAAAGAGGLVNFILSLYLQQQRDWTSIETALAFIPFAVVLLSIGGLAAKCVTKYGAEKVTALGLLVAAAGLGLLALIDREAVYIIDILPGLLLLAGGASLVFSGSAVLSTANVPIHQTGLAGGVMNTAMELGPTFGLSVLMSVASTRTDIVNGYGWAFGSCGLAFIVVALLSFTLKSKPSENRFNEK